MDAWGWSIAGNGRFERARGGVSEDYRLQWGRDEFIAEIRDVLSLGVRCGCFNGAAMNSSRKCQRRLGRSWTPGRFNGDAMNSSGKWRSARRSGSARRCFNGAAMNSSRKCEVADNATDKLRASMGPR